MTAHNGDKNPHCQLPFLPPFLQQVKAEFGHRGTRNSFDFHFWGTEIIYGSVWKTECHPLPCAESFCLIPKKACFISICLHVTQHDEEEGLKLTFLRQADNSVKKKLTKNVPVPARLFDNRDVVKKKKNYKNRFFRVVFSGLVCVHLSPINFLMALFLNQNLWGPVRNEYVRPLVQELLRISKRQQQSQTPSSCTCLHAMGWWKSLIRQLLLAPDSTTLFP